jgi:hypothetical protein
VRYSPDKLPIGASSDGRSHVFLYLLSEPIGDDFRIFLRRQKAWLQDGDRVVDVAMSSSLADAIARENGRFERHELSRQYFHFASLVGSA